ncbi:AfsR/SARP family transcriptional regulator [Streptomyces sp. H27-S2]|uniref:AfsR/SARP family transcriptional regulator n=1 Tax=Streptomyces antarcticus TaxID=2996458 RepID=UPI0022707B15|nr:BTAD domain-containing putative transcriptional regulator [Streptomyces sp. H27-S2]MCY0954185.1 BTAD domain-containing putative transcriptional regulator [Streptomyces sp. H27-S2]
MSAPATPYFSLLGPVQAWHGEEALALGPPQQRLLLAMLLVRRPAVSELDELIDGIWGEESPRTAVGTVRSYVYRLRRILGPALATEGRGYALGVPDGAVDLSVFEAEVARARARVAAGDLGSGAELLEGALRRWRGVPLAGLPGPFARIQRERLAELRLSVLLERLELDLLRGRHARLVPELALLCAEHPRNERLRSLRSTALERAGRPGEAGDASAPPAERRPAGPGGGHVSSGGGVAGPGGGAVPPAGSGAGAVPPPAGSLPPPAQLPYTTSDFTGRDRDTADLLRTLRPDGAEAVVISAVGGIGGVGKTALALHAAHRLREHFPDGQLYANLRGVRDDPAQPGSVLAAFLRALGVLDSAIPEGAEERAALYRSRLAGRRVLLVLDDARDIGQIEPLLPGASSCAVLVTSRSTLPELPADLRIRLDVLSSADAITLLGRILGEARIAAEPAEAAAMAELCGGLPLALRIAGSRLATRPGWSLAAFLGLLEGRRSPFSATAAGEDGVEACFRLSYELLDADEARLFRLLALPDQEDAEAADAAALTGLPYERAEECLERMTGLGLLESPAPGRYRFHDLLRAFARARSAEEDGPGEQAAALARLCDHFLASARNAYAVERPGHPLAGLLTATRSPGTAVSVPGQGHRLFTAQHQSVLAVAVQTVRADPSSVALVADLVLALDPVLDGSFLWGALVEPARLMLGLAREREETRAAGRLGYMLGGALYQLAQLDAAEAVLLDAEVDARDSGDPAVLTEIHNCQGLVWLGRGEYDRALELSGRAIETGERCGNTWGAGNARTCHSVTLAAAGRLDEAARTARLGLRSARAAGDPFRQIYALYALGTVARLRGRPDEAIEGLREGAELAARHGYSTFEVFHLGEETACHLAAGRPGDAVTTGQRVLELACAKGWLFAEARARRLLGTALAALGETDRAREYLTRAVELLEPIRPPEAAQARAVLDAL